LIRARNQRRTRASESARRQAWPEAKLTEHQKRERFAAATMTASRSARLSAARKSRTVRFHASPPELDLCPTGANTSLPGRVLAF
jgi:hypothetical protein